jgi:hypothetical protein
MSPVAAERASADRAPAEPELPAPEEPPPRDEPVVDAAAGDPSEEPLDEPQPAAANAVRIAQSAQSFRVLNMGPA